MGSPKLLVQRSSARAMRRRRRRPIARRRMRASCRLSFAATAHAAKRARKPWRTRAPDLCHIENRRFIRDALLRISSMLPRHEPRA
eukprot:scaffold293861_cov28-Tisochrysis_lutea.AAC.8